jgi:hypothetical protein
LPRIIDYFGAAGASAGGGAALLSAGGAAGASAAGAAGAAELSAGAAGAGALSVVAAGGLAASCFAQAASISAATNALRASLVFIDRYPEVKQEWYENDTNDFFRSADPARIAVINSIESPGDLKHRKTGCLSGRTSGCTVCVQRATAAGANSAEYGSGR